MTNAELEATARQFAELKAVEAKAKSDAKPLGAALQAALDERKATELVVGGVKVTKRWRNERLYDLGVVVAKLARKKDLLLRLIRVDAKAWDAAVKSGELSEAVVAEAFTGHRPSASWVDVSVIDASD